MDIVAIAECNPYCLEQIVAMIMEKAEGGKAVTVPKLPSTLVGVLQMRIDRLAEDERRLLGIAAVIGREFWSGILTWVYEKSHGRSVREIARSRRSRGRV